MMLEIDVTKSMDDPNIKNDLKKLINESSKYNFSSLSNLQLELNQDHSTNNLFSSTKQHPSSQLCEFPLKRLFPLGRGSSSTVYKTVKLSTLQVFAEKVLQSSKPNTILREIEFLKSVCQYEAAPTDPKHNADKKVANSSTSSSRCPYIVQLYDVYSNPDDGTLSLCLEYMNYGSLQDIVSFGGCCNETLLSSMAYQILQGIHYLHTLRIMHRDIKPSNILLNHLGQVKLSDFGIAQMLEVGHSLADSFIGTFEYMAPERLTGEPYSFPSDIWSYGLTLFTVAMGRFPYYENNAGVAAAASATTSTSNQKAQKGFWELMQTIQQEHKPLPPSTLFSSDFIDFVSITNRKDMKQRPNTKGLLTHSFVKSQLAILPHELWQQFKESLDTKRNNLTTLQSSHFLLPSSSMDASQYPIPIPTSQSTVHIPPLKSIDIQGSNHSGSSNHKMPPGSRNHSSNTSTAASVFGDHKKLPLSKLNSKLNNSIATAHAMQQPPPSQHPQHPQVEPTPRTARTSSRINPLSARTPLASRGNGNGHRIGDLSTVSTPSSRRMITTPSPGAVVGAAKSHTNHTPGTRKPSPYQQQHAVPPSSRLKSHQQQPPQPQQQHQHAKNQSISQPPGSQHKDHTKGMGKGKNSSIPTPSSATNHPVKTTSSNSHKGSKGSTTTAKVSTPPQCPPPLLDMLDIQPPHTAAAANSTTAAFTVQPSSTTFLGSTTTKLEKLVTERDVQEILSAWKELLILNIQQLAHTQAETQVQTQQDSSAAAATAVLLTSLHYKDDYIHQLANELKVPVHPWTEQIQAIQSDILYEYHTILQSWTTQRGGDIDWTTKTTSSSLPTTHTNNSDSSNSIDMLPTYTTIHHGSSSNNYSNNSNNNVRLSVNTFPVTTDGGEGGASSSSSTFPTPQTTRLSMFASPEHRSTFIPTMHSHLGSMQHIMMPYDQAGEEGEDGEEGVLLPTKTNYSLLSPFPHPMKNTHTSHLPLSQQPPPQQQQQQQQQQPSKEIIQEGLRVSQQQWEELLQQQLHQSMRLSLSQSHGQSMRLSSHTTNSVLQQSSSNTPMEPVFTVSSSSLCMDDKKTKISTDSAAKVWTSMNLPPDERSSVEVNDGTIDEEEDNDEDRDGEDGEDEEDEGEEEEEEDEVVMQFGMGNDEEDEDDLLDDIDDSETMFHQSFRFDERNTSFHTDHQPMTSHTVSATPFSNEFMRRSTRNIFQDNTGNTTTAAANQPVTTTTTSSSSVKPPPAHTVAEYDHTLEWSILEDDGLIIEQKKGMRSDCMINMSDSEESFVSPAYPFTRHRSNNHYEREGQEEEENHSIPDEEEEEDHLYESDDFED